ncbi:hypothetical protein [Streptomyces sp. OR43]|uniref:hypothetical protein n=1 Tax=Streptomyces sp. or43 TaxID=2478957 RepID=UPI001C9CC259|nr:hypothetical protein [Streptomyces sp. or43]
MRPRGGRLVSPGAVDAAVGDAPWMDLYKLEQDTTGACTFRYRANPAEQAGDASGMEARLPDALEPNPVRVDAVDYLACERSGKFQACVSHLSAEGAW